MENSNYLGTEKIGTLLKRFCLPCIDPALLRQIMTLGTSSLLTQLSIVIITIVNNILLVKYGARSEYGADIPLAAFVVIMKLFQIVLNIAIGIAAGAQAPAAPMTATAIQPSHPGPIITIARQHGSAGKRIGQKLAQRLEIPCYYKEVTSLAAQESGLSRDFISDLNRNAPERLHELYLSTDVVQQAVTAQDRILNRIAENGSCVIVGRAADYVLRDHPDVIRIFIRAPKAYRMRKVMEMYGDTETEAKKNIAHSDAARSAYYRAITGMDWDRCEGYDLCIDSSIGEDAVAEVLYQYLKARKAA